MDAGMMSPTLALPDLESPRLLAIDWESTLDEANFQWEGSTPVSSMLPRPLSARSRPNTHFFPTSERRGSGGNGQSFFNDDGESSAMDMAILVAFHVVSRSKSADQIMRHVVSEGVGPPTISSSSASMGPPVGTLSRKNSVNSVVPVGTSDAHSDAPPALVPLDLAVGGKPSVMTRLPAHLRPPVIDTERQMEDLTAASKGQLAQLLGTLKEAPSPLMPPVAPASKETEMESVPQHGHATRARSAKNSPLVPAEKSPAEQALERLRASLQLVESQQDGAAPEVDGDLQIPLSMLPHFQSLTNRGKRSVRPRDAITDSPTPTSRNIQVTSLI